MQFRLTHIFCLYLLVYASFSNAGNKTEIQVNQTNWPPYLFSPVKVVEQQTYYGLARDIIDYCLAQQNQTASYLALPIKRTHLYMQNGQLDLAIYSYKKERAQFVVYGREPIFTSEYGFAVRKNSDIKIADLSDLDSYRFGHLAGLAHTPALSKVIALKREHNQVVDGYSVKALFGQLLAKPSRIDILANSKETLLWQIKALGLQDKIKVLDYTISQKNYFLTVSKLSNTIKKPEAFLAQIDSCLKTMKQNGKYSDFLAYYGLIAK